MTSENPKFDTAKHPRGMTEQPFVKIVKNKNQVCRGIQHHHRPLRPSITI